MVRYGRWLVAIVAIVASLGLATACSDEATPSDVEPSSAFRATAPTGPTGAGSGNVSGGSVMLDVTGDLRLHEQLASLVSSAYAPAPAGMALVWTAGGTDATTVGLGGLSFSGTQATSPSLVLTITVQAGGRIETFVSSDGECTVTMDSASRDRVSGTFLCEDLRGGGSTVDVEGAFRAEG